MGSSEVNTCASSLESIPEFFSGRSIFITGATGFIGKVLVEKLLYSCHKIDTIYILLRPKRGQDIQQRIQDLTNIPLFNRVREEYPTAFNKLQPIGGDLSAVNLGMRLEDRQLLKDRVSVVYHLGATVRFDTPLTEAVFMNVRGTREIAHLASGMKNLKVLLHTSTTYCNTRDKIIEERLYESHVDWRDMIELAENEDHFAIRQITNKIVGYRPNTYTFTKALAEHVINDYRKQIPVAIVRPSIVVCAAAEPMPGWVDSFNGLVGMLAGGGKGVLHTFYMDERTIFDIIPVDTASKALIIASWYTGQRRHHPSSDTPMYNSTFSGIQAFSMKNVVDVSLKHAEQAPLDNMMYAAVCTTTTNKILFYLLFALFHFLPALVVDSVLWFTRRKTRLMKLNRRIFTAILTLRYFVFNQWMIRNQNFLELETFLLPEDSPNFSYSFSEETDVKQYLIDCMFGVRRYMFKEDDANLQTARIHFRRMHLLHLCLKTVACGSFLWFCYSYSVPQKLFSALVTIVRTLFIL